MCGSCGKSRKATGEVKNRRRGSQTGYDMDAIEGVITGQTTNNVNSQSTYNNRYAEYLRTLRRTSGY